MQVPFPRDGLEILEDLFLAGVLAGPVWILLEGEAVEVAPYVATASLARSASRGGSSDSGETYRVAIVIPGAANAAALFEDDKVAAIVALDEIDRGAQAWIFWSICNLTSVNEIFGLPHRVETNATVTYPYTMHMKSDGTYRRFQRR